VATVDGHEDIGREGAPSQILLETKLTPPRVRPEHVVRDELLAVLRERDPHTLTLVAAPPGFGKTTLLAQWVDSDPTPRAAWLSLDEDDNDPARFGAYLIAALRTAEPEIGTGARGALQAPGAKLIEVVLPLLLNDLASVDGETVLVVDDYHLITNPDIHEAVEYLIGRLPSTLRLVLATREDPPLPLGRLRARGQLAELRVDDLRFSDDETTEFLSEGLGLDLAAADVDRLQTRTEGWPAALYLAALSLRGRSDPSTVIDAFAGDDRYLVDYLTGELLARQRPELRNFLLYTSVLNRLCASLCGAVIARDDSAQLLAELERSNLLLVPLDMKREWYRYHHLFADLLRHELGRIDPDSVPDLHRRAFAWYRNAGLIVDAANHASAAGDVDAAVELVARHYAFFLGQGQLATVMRWLEMLPEATAAQDWLLCFAGVVVTAHAGELDEAERWLALAERAPPVVRDGQEPAGPLAAVTAYLRLLRGDIAGTIANGRRALEAAAADDPAWAIAPQMVLAAALWWSPATDEAKAVLEAAIRTARNSRHSGNRDVCPRDPSRDRARRTGRARG
jgi:LuxR family maltose regulon positive regulatory protein